MPSLEIDALYAVNVNSQTSRDGFLRLWNAPSNGLKAEWLQDITEDQNKIVYQALKGPDGREWSHINKDPSIVTKLWVHPWAPKDERYMVALECAASVVDGNKVELRPLHIMMGDKATVIAPYRMSCCPGRSVLVFGVHKGAHDMRVVDRPDTHDHERAAFSGANIAVADPGDLAHIYAHVTGKDLDGSTHDCGHSRIASPVAPKLG